MENVEAFLRLHEEGKTWQEIADLYGTTREVVRGRAKRYRRRTQDAEIDLSRQIDIPEPIQTEKPLYIPDANALIIGDLHIPHQNSQMLVRAIKVTQKYHPSVRRFIIGGDLFDFDSLSRHSHAQKETDPNDAIRLGGHVLRAIGASFDEGIIVPGNHDRRFAAKLDRDFDMELLVNAALGNKWPHAKIKITNLDYVYLGADWVVGHPSHYSGLGGKTPSEIAAVWEKNIVTLHNHIVGVSQSKSGNYIGVDCGHMTVPDQHSYLHRSLTKFTRWSAGFCVIENGYVYTYSERFTDWKKMGL